MIKPCQHCGQPFEARAYNGKYCIKCRDEANRLKNIIAVKRWKKRHPEKIREYRRIHRENIKRKLIREILSAVKEAQHD